MSKDILGMYGPDSDENATQSQPRLSGGVKECKPLPYSPPRGPMGIMHEGQGLGGSNHGNCGTQGKR